MGSKHPCRSSSLDPPFAPFPHSLLSRNGTHHAQHLLGSKRFIELPSNCKRLGRGVYTTPQNRRANTLSRCRHEQPVNTSKRTSMSTKERHRESEVVNLSPAPLPQASSQEKLLKSCHFSRLQAMLKASSERDGSFQGKQMKSFTRALELTTS